MLNTSAYLRNHDYVCTLSQLVVLRDSRGRTWKQKNYCCCIWALCRLILCLLLKYAFLKNKLKLKRKTWFRWQGIRNIYNHMKCLFTTKYPWFEIWFFFLPKVLEKFYSSIFLNYFSTHTLSNFEHWKYDIDELIIRSFTLILKRKRKVFWTNIIVVDVTEFEHQRKQHFVDEKHNLNPSTMWNENCLPEFLK